MIRTGDFVTVVYRKSPHHGVQGEVIATRRMNGDVQAIVQTDTGDRFMVETHELKIDNLES